MVHSLVRAPNFVSVIHSMGVFFPILRRGTVSTLWSSFFLSFMRLANCILYLGYPKFWDNIHLSLSTYCMSAFVIVLPHSGWYPHTYGSNYRDKVWRCDERMDHVETAISRDPPHNQLSNADTIAYTSKILLEGPRYSCLLWDYAGA